MTVHELVEELHLQPHPEGGYFAEHYRSDQTIQVEGFNGPRSLCTSIYFLLEKDNFSALHRIKSDEIWHFYDGDALEIIELSPEGILSITELGRNLNANERISYTVKAGNWFGSRVKQGGAFSLVGCTVSPGFDFQDFEMPDQKWFLESFPQHKEIILQVSRSGA